MGPVSDQVTEKAKEAAQESLERGKAVAQDAVAAAADTARERGSEEVEGMSSSLQEKAEEIRDDLTIRHESRGKVTIPSLCSLG